MRASLLSGLLACTTALGLLAPASPAHADVMRCASKLVRQGDSNVLLRNYCGEPVDIQYRSILRRPTYQVRGRIVSFGDELVEVPVEIWTYNFGPNKLMRRVRLVDGVVSEIETLGYGFHPR